MPKLVFNLQFQDTDLVLMKIDWTNYKNVLTSNFQPLTFAEVVKGFTNNGIKISDVKEGELLLKPGQTCNKIVFVVRGSFRQYSVVKGEERNFLFYFDNDFALDYYSYITQTESNYYIKALEDSQVIIIPQRVCNKLTLANTTWETVFKNIAHKALVALYKRNDILLTLSPEQRYLKLLEVHPKILQKISLAKIASFIGVTVPSLSRIRKRIVSK